MINIKKAHLAIDVLLLFRRLTLAKLDKRQIGGKTAEKGSHQTQV